MDFKEKVLMKLEEMHSYLNELEDLFPREEKEYVQDLKSKRACEKTIELAIETVIDIISRIVSYRKLGIPESEEDLIDILEKKKILSSRLATKIRQMKGFRNILIHKYGEINDDLVYQFLTEELGDFALFEKEIKAYIKQTK